MFHSLCLCLNGDACVSCSREPGTGWGLSGNASPFSPRSLPTPPHLSIPDIHRDTAHSLWGRKPASIPAEGQAAAQGDRLLKRHVW